ncbi:uncharacterized protein LOC128766021 isoform X3 [Synchiropus splendidus]|uniref:uncharacterized protein LOC128766021 isoform X3 n=1 Tax=Synchiropus splendidus TaxID=270530 RepID=UPI00237DD198|nr:uncharacterized protein LOC128766021 isoform X3 [Synchiropus splendidus]
MMSASQSSVEDVHDLLRCMLKEVEEARSSHMLGAISLHQLLNAQWFHALLKLNQCLVQFNRETSRPLTCHAARLSQEITTGILQKNTFSAEGQELCDLLWSSHVQNRGLTGGGARTAQFAHRSTEDIKEARHLRGLSLLARGSHDYSYPPPAVPLLSLPNSPVTHKRWSRGLQRGTLIPLEPSRPTTDPVKIKSAPSSPATRRSTAPAQFFTLPRGCNSWCRSPHLPVEQHYVFHSDRRERTRVDEFSQKINPQKMLVQRNKQSNELSFYPEQATVVSAERITDQMGANAKALNLLAEAVSKLQGQVVNKQSRDPATSKQMPKPPTPYPRDLSSSSLSSKSSSSSSVSSGSDCSAARSCEHLKKDQKPKVTVDTTRGQLRLNNGTFTQASFQENKKGKSSSCLLFRKKQS